MKMKKGELISALEVADKFVAKEKTDLRSTKMVKIDGANGQISATDLEHWCSIPITISDFEHKVEKRKAPIVMPEPPAVYIEAVLQADLEALTIKEIKEKYPDASGKKKPELVQSVLDAAAVAAEKDAKAYEAELEAAKEAWEAIPVEHVEISEVLCVAPGPLLKMVKSLKDVEVDDLVEIKVEDFYEDMYGAF